MNATDTIAPPPELTILAPAAVPVTDHGESPPPTLNAQPETTPQTLHRKIAKLPKPLRDLINSMLDDGFPARAIIARLQASNDPPLPYAISEMNISDWKNGGYRLYLAQQERLALVQLNREGAHDILASDDITTLPEATLQIVASQYYDVLGDFSPESLKQKLAEDPLKYTRVLNVFSRLVREIVHLKKYRDAAAKTRAAELKKLDPDRDLSDQEFDLLVNKMDKVFKVARPTLSPAQAQPPRVEQPSPPVELQIPIQNQKPELALARESQIEIQNSKIPQAPNLRHSSPSPDPSPLAPRPSDAHSNSDGGLAHEAGIACSPIQNQNSKIQNQNGSQPPVRPSLSDGASTLNSQRPTVPEPESLPPLCVNCSRRALLRTGNPYPTNCRGCYVYDHPARYCLVTTDH